MPSNEDRKAVAAKLRRLEEENHWERARFIVGFIDALGLESRANVGECLLHLADLIEPEERTCEMELCDTGEWFTPECREEYLMCSRCKFVGYYVQVSEDADYWCEKPRYCPSCGAKVLR